MERTIQVWRDPYDVGFNTTQAKEIVFHDGLTVLVGPNGTGKTTLIHNMKAELAKASIPFMTYDNQKDVGSLGNLGMAAVRGDIGFIADSMMSSEGEEMKLNFGVFCSKLRNFIFTGKTSNSVFYKDKEIKTKERWIFVDAIDSGMSIDNIVEVKDIFNLIIEDGNKNGFHVFIVVSANTFEMAQSDKCIDVYSGKTISFGPDDYAKYRKFILNTAKKKNKRDERTRERMIKREDRRNKWNTGRS